MPASKQSNYMAYNNLLSLFLNNRLLEDGLCEVQHIKEKLNFKKEMTCMVRKIRYKH